MTDKGNAAVVSGGAKREIRDDVQPQCTPRRLPLSIARNLKPGRARCEFCDHCWPIDCFMDEGEQVACPECHRVQGVKREAPNERWWEWAISGTAWAQKSAVDALDNEPSPRKKPSLADFGVPLGGE